VPAPTPSRHAARHRSGRIYSAVLLCALFAALGGCRDTRSSLPAPNSIESLCLGVPAHATRIFKLPGIDAVRSDTLVKAQQLHVDVDALERVAAAQPRERLDPEIDEDAVRLYVTDNGGGVLVWWRGVPVTVGYVSFDAKQTRAVAKVFAAAIADGSPSEGGRLIYLLERPAGSTQAPTWKAFSVQDTEHVCT
jgi:hypothetical protein